MKSPLQTAFEKMTDEELKAISGFVTDRSKGAAARLSVIEGQLEHERRQRGIVAKPEMIRHPDDEMAVLVLRTRANQAAHAALAQGTINAIGNLDDEAFIQTARAHYGANDLFGDQAMKAAVELDEQFFKSALAAIRNVKRKNRKAKPEGGESKMLIHIQAALTILHEGDEKGQLPQRKATKQKLKEQLEKRLAEKSFSDEKSWQAFFKRPEIKPFVMRDRNGGRPTTSGKSREIEAFDHHSGEKLQGGK